MLLQAIYTKDPLYKNTSCAIILFSKQDETKDKTKTKNPIKWVPIKETV